MKIKTLSDLRKFVRDMAGVPGSVKVVFSDEAVLNPQDAEEARHFVKARTIVFFLGSKQGEVEGFDE